MQKPEKDFVLGNFELVVGVYHRNLLHKLLGHLDIKPRALVPSHGLPWVLGQAVKK